MRTRVAAVMGIAALVGSIVTHLPLAFAQSDPASEKKRDANEQFAEEVRKRFPLTWKGGSDRIDGNSWRFQDIDIKLSLSGRLDVTAKQTTNRLTGFTGAMVFEILDKAGNVLATWQPPATGVNGKTPFSHGKRTVTHTGQIDRSILLVATQIRLRTAIRTGSQGRLEKNIERVKQINKQISDMGADAAKVLAILGG